MSLSFARAAFLTFGMAVAAASAVANDGKAVYDKACALCHGAGIAGASIVGGLLTALVVYLLAYRRGIQGFRLIIVGIGVSALLGSLNAYLIARADLQDAMTVGFWGAGSLAQQVIAAAAAVNAK